MTMNDVVALAEVKAHLSEFVRRVDAYHERITVTVHGQPTAVLMSPADLEELEETVAVLADPGLLAQLAAAEGEIARGEAESQEQLRQAMAARADSSREAM